MAAAVIFPAMRSSGATSGCAWPTEPVRRVWTEAGGCGRHGGNAAGPAGAESPPPSDTATVPGNFLPRRLLQRSPHLPRWIFNSTPTWLEVLSLGAGVDDKVMNWADGEIENTLMEAGEADVRGQRGAPM